MLGSALGPAPASPPPPPYSVDLVIDRVTLVAGRIHQLSHVAEDNAKLVQERGGEVGDHFRLSYDNVSAEVSRMIDIARDRFYGIPIDIFYTSLICALVVIGLAMLFLVVFGVQKVAAKRYDQLRGCNAI